MCNAMSSKLPIDSKASLLCITLYLLTNGRILLSRFTYVDGLKHSLSSSGWELENIRVNISKQHHARVVAMVSIFIADYVNVQVVSFLEDVAIWNTVSNYVIYWSAAALWKMVETNTWGVSVLRYKKFMHNRIYIVQAHSHFGWLQSVLQGTSSNICGNSKTFDLLIIHHVNRVIIYVWKNLRILINIWGSDDMLRYFPYRRNIILIDHKRLGILRFVMECSSYYISWHHFILCGW